MFKKEIELCFSIRCKLVYCNNRIESEMFHILNMLVEIIKSIFQCCEILVLKCCEPFISMVFQSSYSGYYYNGIGSEIAEAAFYVKEFLGSQLTRKTCLSHNIIAEGQSHFCANY